MNKLLLITLSVLLLACAACNDTGDTDVPSVGEETLDDTIEVVVQAEEAGQGFTAWCREHGLISTPADN